MARTAATVRLISRSSRSILLAQPACPLTSAAAASSRSRCASQTACTTSKVQYGPQKSCTSTVSGPSAGSTPAARIASTPRLAETVYRVSALVRAAWIQARPPLTRAPVSSAPTTSAAASPVPTVSRTGVGVPAGQRALADRRADQLGQQSPPSVLYRNPDAASLRLLPVDGMGQETTSPRKTNRPFGSARPARHRQRFDVADEVEGRASGSSARVTATVKLVSPMTAAQAVSGQTSTSGSMPFSIWLHPAVEGYKSARQVGAVTGMTVVAVDDVDAHHARTVAAGAEIIELVSISTT